MLYESRYSSIDYAANDKKTTSQNAVVTATTVITMITQCRVFKLVGRALLQRSRWQKHRRPEPVVSGVEDSSIQTSE